MNSGTDMRIPVLFGGVARPGEADAWLVEQNTAALPSGYALSFALPAPLFGDRHGIGCSCCSPRGPAAEALTRMFRARATGAAPFFKRVLVLASPAGEAAIRAALAEELLTAARYVSA